KARLFVALSKPSAPSPSLSEPKKTPPPVDPPPASPEHCRIARAPSPGFCFHFHRASPSALRSALRRGGRASCATRFPLPACPPSRCQCRSHASEREPSDLVLFLGPASVSPIAPSRVLGSSPPPCA